MSGCTGLLGSTPASMQAPGLLYRHLASCPAACPPICRHNRQIGYSTVLRLLSSLHTLGRELFSTDA